MMNDLRELDAALARVLGWRSIETVQAYQRSLVLGIPPAGTEPVLVPHFSVDSFVMRLIEDEIERRGLAEMYTRSLLQEMALFLMAAHDGLHYNPLLPPSVPGNIFIDTGNAFLWALIRATPEQRARAALAVLSAHQISSSDAKSAPPST